MKTILIVDDDSVTCKMLSRVFEPFTDNFKVLITGNHVDVQGIIKNQNIDLALMDLQVPGIDAFELLETITVNCPDIPVFVMTAFGTPESKARVEQKANCTYIEKPLDIDILTDTIFDELEKGVDGQINGIGLSSYLQMVEREKKTCTLIIRSDDKKGKLYFSKGELMSATTDLLKNENAAREIITWNNTILGVENLNLRKKKEIHQPLTELIIEGLNIKEKKEKRIQEKTETTVVPFKNSNKEKPETEEIALENRSKEIIAFLNSPISDTVIETDRTKPDKIGPPEDIQKIPKQEKKIPQESLKTAKKLKTKQKLNTVKLVKTKQKALPFSPAITTALSKALAKVQGIYTYGIFDKKDILHKKNTKQGSILKIKPSIYRKISLGLKEVLNRGHLNYIVLTTQDNTRHVLFDYKNCRVVMTVKPGFHLHDFMGKIKKSKSPVSK